VRRARARRKDDVEIDGERAAACTAENAIQVQK
jgi:hypothetical protein